MEGAVIHSGDHLDYLRIADKPFGIPSAVPRIAFLDDGHKVCP